MERLRYASRRWAAAAVADMCIDVGTQTAADFVAARWSIDLLQAIRFLPNVQDEADIKPKFEAELHKRHTALWELQPSLTTFHSTWVFDSLSRGSPKRS